MVTHEYGHGVSNRLVGGPANVSCLQNTQQPGEGWSDWYGLVLTALPGDTGPMPRGLGNYLLGQPTTGPGVRAQRYSTDPAVNTWTFASIAGMAVPTAMGSVWAQGDLGGLLGPGRRARLRSRTSTMPRATPATSVPSSTSPKA